LQKKWNSTKCWLHQTFRSFYRSNAAVKVALPYYSIKLEYDRSNLRQDHCENRNTACCGESVLLEAFILALDIIGSVLLL
jgi:hypothetical protein